MNANGKAKWADQITPGISVPTVWNKATFDSLGSIRLKSASGDYDTRSKIDEQLVKILDDPKLHNVIGCFEGGGYVAKGVYRPSINCIMFSKSLVAPRRGP